MLSVLLFCWAVLTLHTTATCYHLQQTSSLPSGADTVDPETHRWLEAKTYFIRKKGNRRAQKPVRSGSEGNFNSRKDQNKSCFSVLNMKKYAFLCLDPKGKLYTSVFNSNEDCRFRRVKRHKHYDMLQSCRGDVLLVKHHPVNVHARNLPKLSDFVFSKRHKKRTYHRKRRSWHTDPSDPLGSEYPHLSNMRNWKSDPGHGGNVSKETITSVDDPLQVLLSHSAQTPTLEKHRENRKIRF
ncbi:hypothetical protein KOW79_007735 [Hemibagrus wyckioides]|uniref:Fibroblast growth factor 23 n=1 Tax=Hemibagrus wyckioides TaxID=337641 RepID=A0A9D3NUD6_9TELE|nr:uncharacterized protein LOC131357643 [Hemibagrus wyckioides]KAG7329561.1 hypothetical protein KOW79_007735 [Hemibagrus wyckioides]